MNNMLIVSVLALGLAVAQNLIAGEGNDEATSDQEGYEDLPIQEPDMNKSRSGRPIWSYLY